MTCPHRCLRLVLAIAIGLFGVVPTALAQAPTTSDWRATRAQLEAEAQRLDRIASSSSYGQRARTSARVRVAAIRARLENGDFTAGERLLVQIRGQTVNYSDTLTVLDSLIIAIPDIRNVRLHGVLRSELSDAVAREVGEVVRGASVRATSLMRIAVLGEVASPGYLSVPPETLLDQLMMFAGGLTVTTNLDKARIVRGDSVIADADAIQAAIAAGRSIDRLDLRNGDALVLPTRPAPWDRAATFQILSFFIGPLITILLVR